MTRFQSLLTILLAGLALSATVSPEAVAAVYQLRPDGTGDFPTIQAALADASVADGDVIELTDGTYSGAGNYDIDFLGKQVTVRSQSGNAEACIIDIGGTPGEARRGFIFQNEEGAGAVLEDLRITGAYLESGSGGGVYIDINCTPHLEGCIFDANSGGHNTGGTALFVGRWADATFHDCRFENNGNSDFDNHVAGAVLLSDYCEPLFEACSFVGNIARLGGAVAVNDHGRPAFSACTFAENEALIGAAVRAALSSEVELTGCTLADNSAPTASNAVLDSRYGSAINLESCILAFTVTGCPAFCNDGTVAFSCSDVYGNDGGDWVGCIAGQDTMANNLALDPLFCRAEAPTAPYSLRADSPCAADNNPTCGRIGAWPVGCAAPGAVAEEPAALERRLTCIPNPFRGSLAIELMRSVDAAEQAQLVISDVLGRTVCRLPPATTGSRLRWEWDGCDAHGMRLPSGCYLCRIATKSGVATERVLFLP